MENQGHNENKTVSREGVLGAFRRLEGIVVRTPLLPVPQAEGRLWIKCESLQLGGAFKFRGAYNRLARMTADQRQAGVVAFSSGNHAQGVARAAKLLGLPAVIVMPADAPAVKLEGTRALGAEIVLYDRSTESREAIAAALAAERGAVLVPSFDDADVIEGQGTAGLEILEQLGAPPARVVTPCGGGGLASGLALALPATEVVVAEPEGWDDMGRSLDLGEIVPVAADAPSTICDAIMTPRVSPITFGILQARRAASLSVSDVEVEDAIRFAWDKHQIVVEPGAAVGLAALVAGKAAPSDATVVILSGGNIDPALHARIVA